MNSLLYKLSLVRDEGNELKLVTANFSRICEKKIAVWGGKSFARPRLIEKKAASTGRDSIFTIEVRSDEARQGPAGFFLDPATAVECSDSLSDLLSGEKKSGVITLPFPPEIIQIGVDAMYTREIEVESPAQALRLLSLASYLQSSGLKDALIEDYFDRLVYSHDSLEPAWALQRWALARHALRTLSPEVSDSFRFCFEKRSFKFLLQNFDVAMVNAQGDAELAGGLDLSDLHALLDNDELICSNEDNVLRLLEKFAAHHNEYTLSDLCSRFLKPELLHPVVLTDILVHDKLSPDLKPWLVECLGRSQASLINTMREAPSPPRGRSPSPPLPYKLIVEVEGMELLHLSESVDKDLLIECSMGLPFLVCSSLQLRIMCDEVELGFRIRHHAVPALYGGVKVKGAIQSPWIDTGGELHSEWIDGSSDPSIFKGGSFHGPSFLLLHPEPGTTGIAKFSLKIRDTSLVLGTFEGLEAPILSPHRGAAVKEEEEEMGGEDKLGETESENESEEEEEEEEEEEMGEVRESASKKARFH